MAVKIRLKRMGKIRQPYYRIVVADSRTKRDGRVIEEIGKYHPKEDPSVIEVDSERAQYWLGVGAQPSEPVAALLKVTGDWQRFRGEAAPEPMKVAEAKRDKTEVFNDALKEVQREPRTQAVTPRRAAKKTTDGGDRPIGGVDNAPATAATAPERVADEEAPVAQASPVTGAGEAEADIVEDTPEADAAAADATPVAEAEVAHSERPDGQQG